jgi:hypothetical protein
MLAILNHRVDGQHDLHPFGRNALVRELPKNMRRRSRCNPVIFFGAVAAGLLFDVISSPAGQFVWNELLRHYAIHPIAMMVMTVVVSSVACLAVSVVARGAHRAARARGGLASQSSSRPK